MPLLRVRQRTTATVILWTALLTATVTWPAFTQSTQIRLRVPAHTTVKSEEIQVTANEALVVRLVAADAGAAPVIGVYVHRTDGTLAAIHDSEKPSDAFTFPLAEGSYYVVLRNTGDSVAALSIETVRGRGDAMNADLAVVRVFYATDRQRTGGSRLTFGNEPGANLTYGFADVTIPREAHQMGELEGPSIWRLEFSQDERKHVIMKDPVELTQQRFFRDVSTRAKQSARREAFVFVHGFNVGFEAAARRTGQIAYDLAFDGPAILFSWPSQDGPMPWDYRKDQRNAELSAGNLKEFLASLASQSPNLTIHIVAHSMGGRVVAGALQELAASEKTASGAKPLKEVALLAPDIDAALFRKAAGRLAATAQRITLYASERDDALLLSQQQAGYKRAGQAGADIVVVPGIDTIDASAVATSMLGLRHLYYADNSTILSDLFHLLRGRPPAERGRLDRVGTPPNSYWRFRPAVR
jgi:esterase/lipase superfamily enzyme